MGRTAKRVSEIEYDEISFVDIPAAADARIALAKRHQEDSMAPKQTSTDDQPESIFDAEGNQVGLEDLEAGDIVFDSAGDSWEWSGADADDTDDEGAETGHPELAGVSKAFTGKADVSKSLSETLREELAKASSAEQREEVYKRALGEAQEAAETALTIAKRHEDMRLDAAYTEIAKSYNVPEDPEVLGPILKRCGQLLPEADCKVLHKLLTGVGETLTMELGYSGGEDPDPYRKLEGFLDHEVSKSGGKVSKAAATEAYFDDDPAEYDAYLATRNR